jgi:hypothetical protein
MATDIASVRVVGTTSKQVSVAEDWYPTVDGLVTVKLIEYSDGMHRVCVWGGDDTGMEIDTYDAASAKRLFERIGHLVTRADLESWGMKRA